MVTDSRGGDGGVARNRAENPRSLDRVRLTPHFARDDRGGVVGTSRLRRGVGFRQALLNGQQFFQHAAELP